MAALILLLRVDRTGPEPFAAAVHVLDAAPDHLADDERLCDGALSDAHGTALTDGTLAARSAGLATKALTGTCSGPAFRPGRES
jgi:isocitrate/isopropylmalate dehydrogenase